LSGRDLAAALAVVLIWGSNFIAMKFALRDFTPFQLGAARYILAILPLLLVIKPPKLHWKWVVLYGLLQGVGQFGLLFVALHVGMTAALASVLMQTQVFFTALLGFIMLRERASRALQVGLLLAAVGLGCFAMNYVAPHRAAASSTTALGFVLSIASASMWAASNIVVRRAQQSTPNFRVIPFMVWSSVIPIVPFILMSAIFDAPTTHWRWLAAPWSSWVAVAYLGWIATILAYALWTGLLKRHAANRVAPFSLGVPLVGLASGMLVLDEVVTCWQWAGIALIVSALVTVLFGGRFIPERAAKCA